MIYIAQPSIDKNEEEAVIKVLRSGNIAMGKTVEEFENNFSEYIGTKYAIATSNGTTALYLSLLSLGIQKGDEVITTSFSFIASANSILYTGAKPVFVDIDPATYTIDPTLIHAKMTKRTKAILPIHLYGLPANMKEILKIARENNLSVIEDACQAHGAAINGKKMGSWGKLASFSFYATKNMTTGEGGMITTNDKKLRDSLLLLRSHGMKKRYHHISNGYNFRMTNIHAALGITQLKKLSTFNEIRRKNAEYMFDKLKNVEGISLPITPNGYFHSYHQFTIRIKKSFPVTRKKLMDCLKKKGIESVIYYPIPIHKQRVYSGLGYTEHYPVAEKAAKEVLSLPIHPGVSFKDIDDISKIIAQIT